VTAPAFGTHLGSSNVVTWDGTNVGVVLNTLVGADRFLNAGIWGQYATAANVEAGLIWGGHETLTKVTSQFCYTPPGALGQYDVHATAVGMMIAGMGPPNADGSYNYYQLGIAPMADLYSGAIATTWYANPWGSFNFSDQTFYDAYNNFFTGSFTRGVTSGGITIQISGPTDVINSSWGGTDLSGTGNDTYTLALDGFARANPQTSFVVSAGNSGPGSDTVGGPGSGYNNICVGASGDFSLTNFTMVASFSSRGPQNYSDPVHGLVRRVRAAVDLVAPGTSIATAYYGGNTGSNQFNTTPDPTGGAGDYYTVGAAGTSFSAPIVSGAVALLHSASYVNGLDLQSRDARVVKAVLMNSADKLPGWNNVQAVNSAGTVVTTQSLDWAQGAGQLNLNRAYDQYLSGTMDVPGTGGGPISNLGWDYGALTLGGNNDYPIQGTLHGGTVLDVTLDWFRDCPAPSLNSGGTLVASTQGFANLDLQVWNSTFTQLYAESISQYNNVQELHYLVPSSGQYAIRASYVGQMFGTPVTEPYGLAWSGSEATSTTTQTRTAGAESDIIVGGSTIVWASIQNTGSITADNLAVANLRPIASGGTITAGTPYAGTLPPGATGSASGYTYSQSVPGTYLITPTMDSATNAYFGGAATENSTSPVSAVVNVYAHAAGSASGTTIALPDSIVGYTGTLGSPGAALITNAAGFRVNLQTTGTTTQGFVTINNVSGLTPGGAAGAISASATLDGTQAAGPNALGQTFTLTYADDSTLSGASSNLGTQTIVVTGNVYNHAAGSASGTTIALPDSIVGYAGTLSSPGAALVANAAGYRVNLQTTGTTTQGFVSINNVSGLTPGGAAGAISASATLDGTQAIGPNAVGQTFTLTYADDSALSGASSNLGTQAIVVTGNVLDHASASLAPASIDFGRVMLGSTLATPATVLSNAANPAPSTRAGLQITNLGGLADSGSGLIGPGSGRTLSAPAVNTLTTGNTSQSYTIGLSDDQSLLGWTALPSQTFAVTATVVANRQLTATPVAFGAVHLGQALSGSTTISSATNEDSQLTRVTLPAGPFSSGPVTVAAGAAYPFGGGNDAINSTSRTVTASFASVGLQSGAVQITPTAEGLPGESPVPVNVGYSAAVYQYAQPQLTQTGGGGTFSGSGTSYTLDFGSVHGGSQLSPANLAVVNALFDAVFQDNLDGSFNASGVTSAFTLAGTGSFSGVGPGGSQAGIQVGLNTNAGLGSFNQDLVLLPVSDGTAVGLGTTALSPITLELTGSLYAVQSNWIAPAGGSWGNSANWSGSVPQLKYDTAVIANLAVGHRAAATITLDGSRTLGNLTLGSALRAGSYTIAAGSGGTLTLDNGVAPADVTVAAGSQTIAVPVCLNSEAAINAAALSSLTLSGPIDGSQAVVKSGGGTLVFGGDNSYSGGTTVNGGTLTVLSGARLAAAAGALAVNNPNTARGTAVVVNLNSPQTVGSLSGTIAAPANGVNMVTINLTGSTTVLTVDQDVATGYAGMLAGRGGLVKTGSGLLALSGADTYSGGTTLAGGTLAIDNPWALGSGRLVIDGGALDNTSPGPITLSPMVPETWNADFSFIGTQNLNLGFGTVTLAGPGASRQVTVQGGTLTVGRVIGGAYGLSKAGPGALVLAANNNYSGGTTVNGGTLTVLAGARLGAAGGPLAVNNPNTGPGTAVLVNLDSSQTVGSLSGTLAAPASGANSATINLASKTVILTDDQAGAGSYAGALAGPGGLVMAGPGVLALSGASTFTGGTTLAAGTLAIDSPAALGGGRLVINGGAIDNTSPGPVTLSAGNPQTWNADFSFTGTQALNLGTGPVTLAGPGNRQITVKAQTLTVDGNISGWHGLVKAGAGTLDLGGLDNYSGGTTVAAGVLENNGTIAGTTTIQSGALAQGTGRYGPVRVLHGGGFSPGNSIGAVTTGATTWNGGGRYQLDIGNALGTAGAGWDLWHIAGGLSIAATAADPFTIQLDSLSGSAAGPAANFHDTKSYQWEIATVAGATNGFNPRDFVVDTSDFANPLGDGRFNVSESGDELFLDFTPERLRFGSALSSAPLLAAPEGVLGAGVQISASPEPSTLLLFAAAALGLVACAVRRRLTVQG
jgi:autotransporter-associated beta strand protein